MSYEPKVWIRGEKITKEKLNRMEDGIANMSSGVQSDYNQNNNSTEDYIKNRPFYGETHTQWVNVVNDTYIFDNRGDSYELWVEIPPVTFQPSEKFNVIFDGVEYNNLEICWDEFGDYQSIRYMAYLGSAIDPQSGMPDWSDYPFCIQLGINEMGTSYPIYCTGIYMIAPSDSGANHTVRVQHYVSVTDITTTELFSVATNIVNMPSMVVNCSLDINHNICQFISHTIEEVRSYCASHDSIILSFSENEYESVHEFLYVNVNDGGRIIFGNGGGVSLSTLNLIPGNEFYIRIAFNNSRVTVTTYTIQNKQDLK